MNTRIRRKAATAFICLLLTGTVAADEADRVDEQAEARADQERERTEKAINEAVEESLLSLEKDNRLDLDIRLIGPRSISIAARK